LPCYVVPLRRGFTFGRECPVASLFVGFVIHGADFPIGSEIVREGFNLEIASLGFGKGAAELIKKHHAFNATHAVIVGRANLSARFVAWCGTDVQIVHFINLLRKRLIGEPGNGSSRYSATASSYNATRRFLVCGEGLADYFPFLELYSFFKLLAVGRTLAAKALGVFATHELSRSHV
jgi:hypothetical protein